MEQFLDLLTAPARQADTLTETAHRPWPLPGGSWLTGQTWDDLLFAHWRVDAEALRPLVPAGLAVEECDGSAWLGVTPFRLVGLRLHGLPPLPGVSQCPELNVRTYVTDGEKPGVWFFSLAAGSRVAVETARSAFKLPYEHALMRADEVGERVAYSCVRGESQFVARYGPAGDVFVPQPGTLEHFLTERYCLYTSDDGRVLRAEIHHPPWDLQPAEAEIQANTVAPVALDGDPLLHFSRRQDVVIWPPAA
jgi:uncharacterized protein YqjF (DUF2071 family)